MDSNQGLRFQGPLWLTNYTTELMVLKMGVAGVKSAISGIHRHNPGIKLFA